MKPRYSNFSSLRGYLFHSKGEILQMSAILARIAMLALFLWIGLIRDIAPFGGLNLGISAVSCTVLE